MKAGDGRSAGDGPPFAATPAAGREGGEVAAIEGLRGVAALVVVYAHYRALAGLPASPLDFAFTGVDLFFVVSGFVFAPYFFGRTLAVRAFFVRRFFRIYPLYVAALAAYAGLHLLGGRPLEHLGTHLLFLHTWQSREIAFHFNPAFWSLPPEVEFYLALPLLVRWVQGTRAVALLAAAALVLHAGIALMQPPQPQLVNAATIAGIHLPGVLVEFMVGVLVWRAAGRTRIGTAGRWGLLAAAASLWGVLASLHHHLGDAGVAATPLLRGNLGLYAALAYGLLVLASVSGPAATPGRQRAARWLGALSYGVYLFHNAAPPLLQRVLGWAEGPALALAALALTLLGAALAHRLLEAPMRRYGRRLAVAGTR